jgi:hypothetical protein
MDGCVNIGGVRSTTWWASVMWSEVRNLIDMSRAYSEIVLKTLELPQHEPTTKYASGSTHSVLAS